MRKENPKSYDYIETLLPPETKNMKNSRKFAESVGLNAISISAVEGQLIQFVLSMIKPKKIVEIGTLTGLSAQYILAAMPDDGNLWTLEKSEQHAELSKQAISDKRCHVLLGDALDTLPSLESKGPFDAIFIDGNKAAYLKYYEWARKNLNAGGFIIADNVFLSGAVWGDLTAQKFNEKQIEAVRKMNSSAFADPNLTCVIVPTLEGLLICRKN